MTDFFFYPKKEHTGGTLESTDGIDGSVLKDGDAVFVVNPTTRKLDVLTLDADSAADEDAPRVIKPDANAGDKRFVKVKTHDGLHEYLSFYTNFEAAIAGIGSTVKTLVVDTTSTIVLDCTVPATLTLEVRRGGVLTVSSSKTLAVNGKFVCGPYQAFAGAGTVTFAINTVTEIYPEWWGTFPNGSNDTAILNKALAAALLVGSTSGKDNGTVVVRPGIYYIEATSLDPIKVNFNAPNAYFYVTAKPTNQADVFIEIDGQVVDNQLQINIGGIRGYAADILSDVNHYGVGIYSGNLYQCTLRIGQISGFYRGIHLDGQTEQHIAENLITVGSIVGCDAGIYMWSGDGANTQCETNKIFVNYMTYCANGVDAFAGGNYLSGNIVEVQTFEMNGRANATGFRCGGTKCICNTFRSTGSIIPPSGTGLIAGCYDLGTGDEPTDNIFELCYWNESLIVQNSTIGNIFRCDGTHMNGPAASVLANGRSTVMQAAAPSSGYWRVGDKVWNRAPTDGGAAGWICVTAGAPGTWKTFAAVGDGGVALSLGNSWVNFNASSYSNAMAYKDGNGWVSLTGFIKDGTTTAATVIATLASGYRPAKLVYIPILSNGSLAFIYITSTGEITIGGGASATWLSLDNVRFRAA